MPGKQETPSSSSEVASPQVPSIEWEYLELLVGVGNEIWDSSGHKLELNEIQVGDPRFPRHYYSAAPRLNQLGREGWEVTGMIGDLSTYILLLKRPRATTAEASRRPGAAEPASEPAPARRPAKSVAQRIRSDPRTSG